MSVLNFLPFLSKTNAGVKADYETVLFRKDVLSSDDFEAPVLFTFRSDR